jgi:hypothetical protein
MHIFKSENLNRTDYQEDLDVDGQKMSLLLWITTVYYSPLKISTLYLSLIQKNLICTLTPYLLNTAPT